MKDEDMHEATNIDPRIFLPWGKTKRYSDGTVQFGSAIYHLINSASVARALWSRSIPLPVKRMLLESSGMTEVNFLNHVASLVAHHDICKLCPAFQVKVPDMVEELGRKGLVVAPSGDPLPHGQLSGAWLLRAWREEGTPLRWARNMASVIGGHHGYLVPLEAMSPLYLVDPDGTQMGGPAWEEIRREASRVIRLLEEDPGRDHLPEGILYHIFVAGMTATADWISSDDESFPLQDGPCDLGRFTRVARARAKDVIERLGWERVHEEEVEKTFGELFHDCDGKAYDPLPMQQAMIDLLPSLDRPALIIVEAPMGEGKTEAALLAADHLRLSTGARGINVALPTQATSDSMFPRFRDFLRVRFSEQEVVDLQLIHGTAVLNDDVYSLRHLAPDEDSGVVNLRWFASNAKKKLLSRFTLGTLDSYLLSVLPVRHNLLRLFSLMGKVVIIDEVHSYDTFTTSIIEDLLRWLATMGCSVIILSATLPAATKRTLVEAYRGEEVDLPASPYPRITVVDDRSSVVRSFPAKVRNPIRISWVPNDAELLVDSVWNQIADGGCVAIVVNTVARAQEIYGVFAERFAGRDVQIDLLHAQFPFGERKRRTDRILEMYGKDSSCRPFRGIVISTQVLEQSLDLDFDMMVSDLAPIDLLLQRAGRMHRHDGIVRPHLLAHPSLMILDPVGEEGMLDADWLNRHHRIYSRFVLLQTYRILRGVVSIDVPEDVEPLIESVYSPDVDLFGEGPFLAAIRDARRVFGEERRKMEATAKNQLVRLPDRSVNMLQFYPDAGRRDENANVLSDTFSTLTRWFSVPNVTAACVFADGEGNLFIDRERTVPFDVDVEDLSFASIKSIYANCIRIADWTVAEALSDQELPEAWERSSILRGIRILTFDAEGNLELFGKRVRVHLSLDPTLGLVKVRERWS